MPSVTPLQPLLDLLRRILLSSALPLQTVLRRLLYLWTAVKCRVSRRGGGRKGSGLSRLSDDERGHHDDKAFICASRRPQSAIYSHERSPVRMDQAGVGPSRPVSVIVASPNTHVDHLYPEVYSLSNPSRNVPPSHSESESEQEVQVHPPSSSSRTHSVISLRPVSTRPPSARAPSIHPPSSYAPSSRASSRNEHRLASGRNSRSRSRSRAPSLHRGSRIDLPYATSMNRVNSTSGEIAAPARDIRPPSVELGYGNPARWRLPVASMERYDRNIIIPKKDPDYKYVIKAATLDFPRADIPKEWIPCTHPEGGLYFFHQTRLIYTDLNVCKPEIAQDMELFADELEGVARANNIEIPPGSELVVEYRANPEDDTVPLTCYYYVHREKRTLFWVEDHDFTVQVSELMGPTNPAHLSVSPCVLSNKNCKCRTHLELFSYNHMVDKETINELQSIVLYSMTDQLTSHTSTIMYSVDELRGMLDIAKATRKLGAGDYTTSIVGQLMAAFAHPRFLNYHGQYGAHLCRDQSVHGTKKQPRMYLIRTLGPMFFNAPMVHLRALEKIWIDQTMCKLLWAQFIEKLKSEWQEFTLFATVLLNANVAFLAIPSVDPGDNIHRTAPQIVSYISMVTSIGSIIVGLLLVHQYWVKPRDTVEEVAQLLMRMSHPTRGIETLAILYSLLYALLMWGMVTFLLAFSLECFITQSRVAIIVGAVVWALVSLLILWCIYIAWDKKSDLSPWKRVLYALKEKMGEVKQLRLTILCRIFPSAIYAPDRDISETSVTIQTV